MERALKSFDMKLNTKIFLILFVMIFADQVLKFYIKLSMTLGESYEIFSWFQILFVENPGMAFGLTLGSKMFLTLFRIVVCALVFYYLIKLLKSQYKFGYIFVVNLILAGALGNIIDCMFYGMIFSESTFTTVATLFPEGGGYAPFLMGKVVDMFYFPLFTIPQWIPYFGVSIFFSPVFNLFDSYIPVVIILLIIFYRHDFNVTIDTLFKKDNKQCEQ